MANPGTKPNIPSAGVGGIRVIFSQMQSRFNTPKPPAKPFLPRPISVLLIGSTGNGKSSLGNFLLDPSDEHILGKNKVFVTARSNKPQTQLVQCECDRVLNPSLQVIDTPGLNESATKDLSHMIQIVKKLRELKSITACIFCIKFDSKIDAQYKATIAYYRKLLPSLFEGNVIIVLTNFPTDRRSALIRERQGVDVNTIVCNAQNEIVKSGSLAFNPPVFLIDTLPISEEERRYSERCRLSILDYIRQSFRPICVKKLYVAKTPALKEIDEQEIKRLDGEIHGYNMRLKEVTKGAAEVLDKIEEDQKQAAKLRGEIRSIEALLHEKDSEETVTVGTWNLKTSWKWFQSQTQPFEITSEYPIVKAISWDNGHLEWKSFQWFREPARAYGEVKGKWFRGLYATVNLVAEKRIRYKKEIESCKKMLTEKNEAHKMVKDSIKQRQNLKDKHQQNIYQLNQYIEERNKRKEEVSSDPISIEEADKRLTELRTMTVVN